MLWNRPRNYKETVPYRAPDTSSPYLILHHWKRRVEAGECNLPASEAIQMLEHLLRKLDAIEYHVKRVSEKIQ